MGSKDEGITIEAITPQNESLYVPTKYPGMSMNKEQQTQFINSALGPNVKIFCYDHNWDVTDYTETVVNEVSKYVDGTAWHHYDGNPTVQDKVHSIDKSKEVHFTEGSGGEWIPPFHEAFQTIISEGIDICRNWSKSYIL